MSALQHSTTLLIVDPNLAKLFRLELAATCLGVIAVVIGGRALYRAWQTRWWKPVPGEIIESRLCERRDRDRYGCKIIEPRIRYTYRVNGTDYTSDTITLSRSNIAGAGETPLTRIYRTGTRVTVFHHPRRYSQATLRHTPRLARTIAFVVAVAWTLVFGMAAWRQAQNTPAEAVAARAGLQRSM